VTLESTSAEDVGISDASGYTGGSCCKHRLNLPLEASNIKRLRDLEHENGRMKPLHADLFVEKAVLTDVIATNPELLSNTERP
jgi:hypothetical protein